MTPRAGALCASAFGPSCAQHGAQYCDPPAVSRGRSPVSPADGISGSGFRVMDCEYTLRIRAFK
jgi:hypothetical protein